jgi:hypothetical protein
MQGYLPILCCDCTVSCCTPERGTGDTVGVDYEHYSCRRVSCALRRATSLWCNLRQSWNQQLDERLAGNEAPIDFDQSELSQFRLIEPLDITGISEQSRPGTAQVASQGFESFSAFRNFHKTSILVVCKYARKYQR